MSKKQIVRRGHNKRKRAFIALDDHRQARSQPHSPEWLEQLMLINPRQSAITATLIAQAGTPLCCSICGDTEDIADYTIKAGVSTIRLCSDCKHLQQTMFGLVFVSSRKIGA